MRKKSDVVYAARLNHSNIVEVFDVGSLEGGGAYIVMDRPNSAVRPKAELLPLLTGAGASRARR